MTEPISSSPVEFNLSGGGPAFAVMKALNLSPYPGPRAVRAGIVLAAIAWLPPLVLSFAQGVATGDAVRLPFLYDSAAYARLLIAVPLFDPDDARMKS